MSIKEMKSAKGRERAVFARRVAVPKVELNDVDRNSEMTPNNGGQRAVAIDAPARSRATVGKAEPSDRLQQRTAPTRPRLGEGGKPLRLRRGAVETPLVQSVERALSILEAVARSAEPVPLANLTDVLGIDPSSVFRLANTLKRRGFLANPNGRKHYVLGPAVWRLSREYSWSRMLISICREAVKALAVRTGETAHLAVREGREVFFIDHYASGEGLIVAGQTGKLMPLHCTAHGKALLADFGLADLKALYGTTPLERFTARTSVSLPDLATACSSVRADGFSIDDGEYLEDVRCVAAPVRDQGGLVIGSIGVSAPATRMPDGRDLVLAQHVRDAAEHINAMFGV